MQLEIEELEVKETAKKPRGKAVEQNESEFGVYTSPCESVTMKVLKTDPNLPFFLSNGWTKEK